MRGLILLAGLIFSGQAFGADVDVAPSGTAVTIRTEVGERIAILDEAGVELDLGVGLSEMWLVHKDAWRQAVALGERVAVLEALPDEQSKVIAGLEIKLKESRVFHSEARLQFEASNATVKGLKKSRTQWLVGGLVVGAVAGASGVAVIVL